MAYTHRNTCRICSSSDLTKFLSLGNHPPVDTFVSEQEFADEKRYPLDVYFCRHCSLVQLCDVVSPEELFHNEYAYFSSASQPLVRHFEAYATSLKARNCISPNDLIIDIGSNDGIFLQFFTKDYRVLGVEPADNVATVAREKGIETITEFFNEAGAKKIRDKYGEAKVISASNVFAHIDDIDEIIRGVKALLAKDGVYIFEAHYLVDLIEKVEFDTIYHEHLCFYSVKPLQYLFDRFDMEIFDVERVAQHGGSIRVFTRRKSGLPIEKSVNELLALEAKLGLHAEEVFLGFQEKVESIKDTLVNMIRGFRAEHKKIVGYGAPAKGNTLLNFCEFTPQDLEYISDTTPHKIGLFTPGSHIQVVSPEVYKTDTPDYILLLAWNYREFILEKEKELRSRGAKFIIPIPNVEIV